MMLGMYAENILDWWYPHAWWFFALMWFFLIVYFVMMVYTLIRILMDKEEIALFVLGVLFFFVIPAGAIFMMFYWVEKGVVRKKPR
jgi:hypothetical protein